MMRMLAVCGVMAVAVMPASAQLGVGGGMFVFLNGASPGAVINYTSTSGSPTSITVSAWGASIGALALGFDPGLLIRFRSKTSPFLRLGTGLIAVDDAIGLGLHAGAGLIVPASGGKPGVRLDALWHGYFPDGGIPVTSVTLSILLPTWSGSIPSPVIVRPRR
jgi:hypothetical protein